MTPVLETARLILRPLTIEDAPRTQLLFPHWEIVRHLAGYVPWPYPSDGALSYYRDVALPAMERGEEWHWTLRLRNEPAEHVGAISLMRRGDNRGFWVGLPWQGRGLMSEAVVPVTDYWFNELGMPTLRVPKAVGNQASRRISEKTGMRVVGTEERQLVGGRMTVEIWETTAEEWRHFRRS